MPTTDMPIKRLVFCFDGTWNRLDAPNPTNVVVTAETVLPLAPDGTAQLIFYDEGVGTDKNESLRGGMFGRGLIKNLADGYRFLIFNYTPGDEIYVFGFSRGAYTARSFVGLLNTCGVLVRKQAARVAEAIDLYKQRDVSQAFKDKALAFRRDYSPEVCCSDEEANWRSAAAGNNEALGLPRLSISYVGVWDTVGALGIPSRYTILSRVNKKHEFHDTALSAFVKSARHAVAIDERRTDFAPTLWDNLDDLNEKAGPNPTASDAPYQQVWFPGVHSAVGGGGERRGLSDQALDWILDGARAAGLVLDGSRHSRIFELRPDYREYIENSAEPGLMYKAMNYLMAADRAPGPDTLYAVSVSAKRRWLENPENLKDGTVYRPPTLSRVADALNALDPRQYGLGSEAAPAEHFDLYEVKRGDGLRAIAKDLYGDPNLSDRIFKANLDKLDNPDRIYPGMILRIPKI